MWKILDLHFPWSLGGDTMKQRERETEVAQHVVIYNPYKRRSSWAGPAGLMARSQPGEPNVGEPAGPEPAAREAHWNTGEGPGKLKGRGEQNGGEGGRKLRLKSQSDLSHALTPPSAFFFCQFLHDPRKTRWLKTQYLEECMSRGHNLHSTLSRLVITASIDLQYDWFHVNFNVWGCIWLPTPRPHIFGKCMLPGKLWQGLIRLNWLPVWSTLWNHSSGIYHAVAWHHCVYCSYETRLNQTSRDRGTTPQPSRLKWRI